VSTYLESISPSNTSQHIDFGDSLEVQAKKQKMARAVSSSNTFALSPSLTRLQEPGTSQDLQYSYEEAKEREGRLVKRMEAMDKQITDLNYWAERRQGDYEDLRDKWSNLHHDKIDLTAELEQKTKNWEKGRTEILSLKGERGTLTKEIEALRLQLLNHPNPAIAAAEREAAKIRTLEAENASLKKKNENLTKESTYIRDAYQQAASSATDLSNELNELKREVSPLRRSKEEFKAWRKAQRNDQEKLELRKEVDNLKVMVKSRERLVGRKEEQIKDLQQRGRGGVQTRGSSAQPRSPRGGSRGVSPAPGTLGGGGKGPSGLSGMFNVDG